MKFYSVVSQLVRGLVGLGGGGEAVIVGLEELVAKPPVEITEHENLQRCAEVCFGVGGNGGRGTRTDEDRFENTRQERRFFSGGYDAAVEDGHDAAGGVRDC